MLILMMMLMLMLMFVHGIDHHTQQVPPIVQNSPGGL
jgi:hypothetical protein